MIRTSTTRQRLEHPRHFGRITDTNQVDEWIKCRANPYYFIEKYVLISTEQHGQIPFRMYGFQKAVLRDFLKYRANIVLKPRQMGLTTLMEAYALWFAMFHGERTVAAISLKLGVAKNMLRNIKNMYVNLPLWLRMPLENGGGKEIGSGTKIIFQNGSSIEVLSATEDAGRSLRVSLFLWDEAAFQRYASQIWSAAGPALSTGGERGGRVIINSTAFGIGTFYHNTWTAATQGQGAFHPIRLRWQWHPERNEAWYQRQLMEIGRKRVAQEIDCNFLQSGYNVFDPATIREIEDRARKAQPWRVERLDEEAAVLLWEEPRPGMRYVIGADVASGRARDYSSFSIMDSSGNEVGCFKGQVGIEPFAKLLMKYGKQYNRANLAPEVNGIGEGIIAHLQAAGYSNVYNFQRRTKRKDERERGEAPIFGWQTTGKTRPEILTTMDDDLRMDRTTLCNPYFAQEAYTFVYNANGKAEALGKSSGGGRDIMEDTRLGEGYTDDAIMGACIANYVAKTSNRRPRVGGIVGV